MSATHIGHVAKYILEQVGTISTMKLQKLCYYTQVWNLHFSGEKLVEQEFQAWANGPVSYELFDLHRGRYFVDANSLASYSSVILTSDQKLLIDSVLDSYGDMSGAELSALSHSESPWIEARGSASPGMLSTEVISAESMKQFAELVISSSR
jgi:uncharacterized phage-associated protein